MSVIRLILLLAVLGCLTLLLVQNWSPVLPLVFLGLQSQPLPLSMWILFSVVAGAFTSLFITGCFQLSNYFAQSKPRKRRKAAETSPPRSTQSSKANYTAANTSQPKTASTTSDNFNEWESDASDDDWDFDAKTDKTPKYDTQEPVKDRTNYEVNNEPKSSSRSGSVYSYSYREPSNSGVGKTESVYDATIESSRHPISNLIHLIHLILLKTTMIGDLRTMKIGKMRGVLMRHAQKNS